MVIILAIFKNIKLYFKEYLKDYKKEITGIFIFLFIVVGINVGIPIVVSYFIDSLDKGHANNFFVRLSYLYIALLAIKIIVEIINSYVSERLGWTISNKLRYDLIKHTINLDFKFHREHKSGEMIERVDGDVTFLSNFFSMFIVNIVGNSIFVIFIIAVFFTKSILVGIGYGIIATLAYVVFLSLQSQIIKLWTAYREDEAQLYGYIQESVIGRDDIIGIGEQSFSQKLLVKYLRKVKKDYSKAVFVSNIPTAGFFSLLNIGDVMALGIGAYLFYKNQMTLGSIYLITNYVGLLNKPFIVLRYELENLQKIGASLGRISDLFALKSNVSSGTLKLDDKKIGVDIKNISFSYSDTPVLKDVSMKVKPGETIGIVGKTGSGKTTLIKLLSKMYDVSLGEILINGKNIQELSVEDFYKHVCVVSQNNRIFNGTVYENLTCFDSSVDRNKIKEVIKTVGLYDWLESLPNGIDTVINKTMLSVGQAQLLCIAKSFLSNFDLYIFDEINSNLDENSENKIIDALKKLQKDKTVFIIAHKLKILDFVDKVLIMENGEIKLYDERKQVSNNIIEENLGA